LKYKDLELDFGRELKELEKDAQAIDITPQPPKSIVALLGPLSTRLKK
jgi:hypothetical protein